MKLDYMRMNMEVSNEESKLVSFAIDEAYYGIDIMDVLEVINPAELVKVPTLPSYVVGVADHRENIVPIIDLRRRFRLQAIPRTKRTKWIILRADDRILGIEVDRVVQVVAVTSTMKKARLQMSEGDKPWIRNVYRTPELLVFELDLKELIETDKLDFDSDMVRKSEL